MEAGNKRQVIVLVDDDKEDRQLMTEAAGEAGIVVPLHCLENGEELKALLFPAVPASLSVQPLLILLDLNLPLGGGRKSLEMLKQSETYKRTPVVVFTTSAVREEVGWVYATGANSLILKPFSYNALVEIMRLIKTYWLETVELP